MLHGPKSTQKLAASMRREMTLPEVLLWRELRKRPGELKFRRQHPSGRYGLDFFCASARLAVEVDGAIHETMGQPERDAERDAWLHAQGVTVLRMAAVEILRDMEAVVHHIVAIARG